jgi:diguanylate cyclase (GGDEF)-like protein
MAKVLVVDDHPANRALIVTLLKYQGHEALEAADGAEGLAIVRAERPDLVVCDVLMPTMDGYEFVRQLRADAQFAHTEVIFYTAYYLEREARNLAKSCGVSHVLIKPSMPEEIMRTIDQALGKTQEPEQQPGLTPEFDREHLRLLTDKLSEKIDELQNTNQRFTALFDINLQMGSERNPHTLLEKMCRGARDLIGAKYAVLCIREKGDGESTFWSISGMDATAASALPPPRLDIGPLGQTFSERKSRRIADSVGDVQSVGLPTGYPSVHSMLVAPVVSLNAAYGWVCLIDKLGAREFSEEDERMLSIHAAQVGRIYENGSLYVEVERHASQLQEDVNERERAETKIRRLNRVYAVLSGINTLIVRVHDREELFREACEIAVSDGHFRLAWIGLVDRAAMQVKPVAWHGVGDDYIKLMPLGLRDEDTASFGLAGHVVNQGKVSIVDDMASDVRVRLRKEATRRGFGSLAMLPLLQADEVVGVLALYAEEKSFFDEDELKLLQELVGNIAFALDHIAKEEKLNYLAYYDTLTGLANPTLFRERLAQYVATAQSEKRNFAIVLFDIDHFKTINDAHGRHAGDELLKAVAERLTGGAARPGEIARIGADHFVVVLPDIRHETEVGHRVKEMHERYFDEPFRVDGTEVRITVKSGIVLYPNDGGDAETLLTHAEAALKTAKASGERRFFYTQGMTERIGERIALQNKLRQALEKGEYVLHYQPKVDLETRRIQGVEALIRWQSPERGLVPPADFIPLLEESGLIHEVGAWALRQAVLDHRGWVTAGVVAPRVAVNVSAAQLRGRDFADVLREALRKGADPPGIDIEITESVIMDDVAGTIGKLGALRDMGVSIAIDDFGTGYSSLGYLARLPVHSLKIDRSFIVTMADDPDTMTIVAAIISLAHSLSLKVVAEGVETEEQAQVLRLLRCDEMQGYLISRPVPKEQLLALLTGEQG